MKKRAEKIPSFDRSIFKVLVRRSEMGHTPEGALWCAVIAQAVADGDGGFFAEASDDEVNVETVSRVIGIDPGFVRGLVQDLSDYRMAA